MRITMGRWSRLAALGAGLATAAALATSGAGPALADTTDTGGTAAFTFSTQYLEHLAAGGVILMAEAPASSSYSAGTDALTVPVTGGNGEVSNFFGSVHLGGKIRVINVKTGKFIILAGLNFSFDTGTITAKPIGSSTRITIADIGGDLSTSSSAGPPATETFSCDQLTIDSSAASFLNSKLGTKAFTVGANTGGFTTTFDVTVV